MTTTTNGDDDDDDFVNVDKKQLVLYQEPPTFVKVVGMLPAAMFWTVAQPLAKYSGYEWLMEKMGSLAVEEAGVDMALDGADDF